jgi:hypothetical protein
VARLQVLERWIHSVLVGDIRQSEAKECTHLVLMHKIGESEDLVVKIPITEGQTSTPQEYAKTFMGYAEDDAHDLQGQQEYALKAFYGRDEYSGRHVFRVIGKGQTEGEYQTDPPDRRGQTQQLMRGTELMFTTSWQFAMKMMNIAKDLTEEMAKDRREAVAENRDMMVLVRDLVLAQTAENYKAQLDIINAERNAKLAESAVKALPSLANQAFGKEIFPQSHADTELITMIAENIEDEKQLAGISMFLPKEVAALVINRFTEIIREKRKKKEAAEAAAKLLAQKNATPEDETDDKPNGGAVPATEIQ